MPLCPCLNTCGVRLGVASKVVSKCARYLDAQVLKHELSRSQFQPQLIRKECLKGYKEGSLEGTLMKISPLHIRFPPLVP